MEKKEIKNTNHRFSIYTNNQMYQKIRKLENNTNTKSMNKIINILLDDELNHPTPLNNKNIKNVSSIMFKLNNSIGELNRHINSGYNNLNQLTYKINKETYNYDDQEIKNYINKNQNKLTKELKNLNFLKTYKDNMNNINKVMIKIWQLLK